MRLRLLPSCLRKVQQQPANCHLRGRQLAAPSTPLLRAAQLTCLVTNLPQFEDRTSDPDKIGRYVAMSCTIETEKLVYYAVPNPTPAERKAFEDDAVMRATGLVIRSRNGQT